MIAAEVQAVSGLQWLIGYDLAAIKDVFISPGGAFAIGSLFTNLCMGLWLFSRHQRKSRKAVNPKALIRVALPKRIWATASGRTDIGFAVFNMLVFGIMFGWAIVTSHAISNGLNQVLSAHLGQLPEAPIPDLAAKILVTIGLYVAFEFGYWVNHYLAHEVPALWELHKVHHTA
ncbi:MAG: hypothetical protein JSS20_07490, partial [Proteobacteria bacterium]|nr:hypothetical protein [Pseudomonadota bacterium]